MDQKTLASIIERPPQFVSDLIHGKRELTIDTAQRLEAALGISAGFWIRYEAEYRLNKAEREPRDIALFERIREKAAAV
jgi:HTH-type transcriptional regulator/antitoxin HigA